MNADFNSVVPDNCSFSEETDNSSFSGSLENGILSIHFHQENLWQCEITATERL